MSKHFNEEETQPQEEEKDTAVLISKVIQQLAYLEKKIDILLSQSQSRPSSSFKERSFSKPYRSYGQSQQGGYRGSRDRDSRPQREGNYESKPYYDKRQPRENRGFDPNRSFDKREDRGNRHFDPKKKPFSHKRRDRD